VTHSWRRQDPNAAAAWLATFPSLAKAAGDRPRPTLESLGLAPLTVQPPATLRTIAIDDVSDTPDDL
jgi:hypothetical protein